MDLESFGGFDMGEGMSEAAFEAFKEKMKAAAAQIAAIKREEKKQKKKEEELLKILLKFVKHSQKKHLVLLISRALEQNIPANFVLAIILLGNEEVQEEVRNYLTLKGGGESDDPQADTRARVEAAVPNEQAMVFFRDDETLPLKAKIELDAWMKALLVQAEETPQKLIKNSYDIEYIELDEESEFGDKKYRRKESIKAVLIQLVAFVLEEFMNGHKIETSYEKVRAFAQFIIKWILEKTKEGLEERGLLSAPEQPPRG